MSVLTTKRQVGTTLPMIVETPDHIIIEGQSYDKATLNPTMLKPMMYHNHDGINNMIMNRSWIRAKTRNWNSGLRDSMADPSFMKWDGGAGIAKQVWASEQNPNEFYIFASCTDHNICKVDKSTLKINKIEINNLPLDENRIYYVGTSDYLANGGDNMTFFKESKIKFDMEYKLRNMMIDYFKKVDTIPNITAEKIILE